MTALFAWARSDDEAFKGAAVWRGTQVDDYFRYDWHRPDEMERHARETVSDEELRDGLILGADASAHIDGIREIASLGATVIVLQQASGSDPLGAIEFYGRKVLPAVGAGREVGV
jgi:coenzyme F420-dependent glucose-6-phosphate dehydrogenase